MGQRGGYFSLRVTIFPFLLDEVSLLHQQLPWMGDFALVETNLKLSTSMRRPSQRKSACGSPQNIPKAHTAARSNATI
jgi:hypothetical protein